MLCCGLLGRSLGHSYSPEIHRAFGGYAYRLYEVEPEGLEAFLKGGNSFHGLNVTIPYKTDVIPYLDSLTPEAEAIGSVNTILRLPGGGLLGDNTDGAGFRGMVERSGVSVSGKKALVLGSGGASLAVCHVLRAMGAESVVVISRRGADSYETLHRHRAARLLVNTTPVGMYPNAGRAAVDLVQLPALEAVFELIYNPARTALMLQAEALGIPAFGGLPMLVFQARAAAERFAGREIPEARAEAVLRDLARRMENLILIGMPGCGKTEVGKALAMALNRPFVDVDQILEAEAGCSISEIFAQEGESGFRARETQILAQLGQESGQVIATGGGCVTRRENDAHLRQNGRILFLERALGDLAREGRPLSLGGDLRQMYEARLPLYRQLADYTVENNEPAEQVAARICEVYYENFGH